MPVYKEMEDVQAIYFLESGLVAYVLPRYQYSPFVLVEQGDTFGTVDIAFRILEIENKKSEGREIEHTLDTPFKHKFTTYTKMNSVVL